MNGIKWLAVLFLGVVFCSCGKPTAGTQETPPIEESSSVLTNQISQYGITWTFDADYPVGQFITGDWWVVGPVTVIKVSPKSGPSTSTDAVNQKSIYGASALRSDNDMRNGSMVVLAPNFTDGDKSGFDKQGYDSRVINYAADRSIQFSYKLAASRSLISTVSSETVVNGKLETPYLLGQEGVFLCATKAPLVLETAAVLTCLDAVPPADAFRPTYAGTEKQIFRATDIQWDRLPKLPSLESTPDWEMMERIFDRPWIDHVYSWTGQYMLPGLNGPHYGREFSRMSSIASLMLLLDEPQEKKTQLMLNYLQFGIDTAGLAQIGRNWSSDGGHWQGRKWPILFASLMLDAPELRNFPAVDLSKNIYGPGRIRASDAEPVPTTLFQEDMDYYYGKGGDGQTALWQIVVHTGPQSPHQETPRAELTKQQQFCENYYNNNVAGAAGVALAAQLMGARKVWNMDAFFDHLDYWMTEGVWQNKPSWIPAGLEKTFDPFVEDMWAQYRDAIPEQASGKDNFKWVWEGYVGHWEENPKKKYSSLSAINQRNE